MLKSSISTLLIVSFFMISCNSDSKSDTTTSAKAISDTIISLDTIHIKPSIKEPAPSLVEKAAYANAYKLWFDGKPEESIGAFRKFLSKYPKSSLADNSQDMLGSAYGSLKNYDKSIEEFKKVKTNYPDADVTPQSLYNIAYAYFFEKNDFVKAKYYYVEFINSATTTDGKFRRIAIDQLNNWAEETKRFEGYSQRRKEEEKSIQLNEPAQVLKITKENWQTGGFGSVGLHDLSIQNTSDITFKDVIVKVLYYSETSTFLGSSTRTIYKSFPGKKTIRVKDLNTGFIPADAKRASVVLVTALPL